MKPQDISVLLMLKDIEGQKWTYKSLSKKVLISASDCHSSVKRLCNVHLYDDIKRRVNGLNTREFLIHALKYLCPPELVGLERGIPTSHSHPQIGEEFAGGSDILVWPYFKGKMRGTGLLPLSNNIPEIVNRIKNKNESVFYLLAACLDSIRVGRAREKEIAIKILSKHFN